MNRKRVNAIDGIRGWSLFGILMANMLIFQFGIWGKDSIELYSLSSIDLAAYKLVKVLVEGSFMPIFTFLFGYSMIKMKESLEARGKKVKRHFFRRFFLLLTLGILHSTYLWEGDILTFYGIMGMFLLLFLKRKEKTLLIWALVLLLLTSLLGIGDLQETSKDKERMERYVTETMVIYGSGTYDEIKERRNSIEEDPLNLPDYMYLVILMMMPFMTAPLFLLGMYASKRQWFEFPKKEKSYYVRAVYVFVPAGILLKSFVYLLPSATLWTGAATMLGANLLALGYIALFALLYTTSQYPFFKSWIENVGKLSLSNYLLQSILCTSVFYGYGLGQFGKLGVVNAILLALAIYCLQMVISTLYLRYFHQGPVEKLVRIVTNLSWKSRAEVSKKQKMEYQQTGGQ